MPGLQGGQVAGHVLGGKGRPGRARPGQQVHVKGPLQKQRLDAERRGDNAPLETGVKRQTRKPFMET